MAKKGVKFTDEHKKKLSQARINKKNELGFLVSEETRKKLSQIALKNGSGKWMKGRKNHMSKNAKEKMSLRFRGENNPRWSGGLKLTYLQKLEIKAGRPKSEQCEICGCLDKIVFDHCHTTGKFRGWICSRCNLSLGLIKDNKETLQSMINYLSSVDKVDN